MLNRFGTRSLLAGLVVLSLGLAFPVVGCSSSGGGVGGAV